MKLNGLSRFLGIMQNALKGYDDCEIDDFLDELSKFCETYKEQKRYINKIDLDKKLVEAIDFPKLLFELRESEGRGAALEMLNRFNFNKIMLTNLAKAAEIYLSKSDKLDTIKEKIIEATVGARLRSSAVRGDG